jgi:nucleotide-binding universal stress UspA family protein
MIQLTNILVPIDFSPVSERAIGYGLSLALEFHARIVLAHVVPSLAALNYAFPAETYELEKQAYNEARQRLPEMIPPRHRDGVDFRAVVRTGDVRAELAVIVAEEKADVVVMGTHGRRIIQRFLLGSTTENMLRTISIPVLTVGLTEEQGEAHRPGPVPIRRIVYATDYSDAARKGIHYAAELARTFGAEMTVLHVMDRFEQWGSELLGHLPDDVTKTREVATAKVRQLAALEQTADLKIRTAVIEGTPFREIVRFAESDRADLIVLGIQSKSTLERAMLGATAERVIRSSPVPVLSIPVAAQ